MLLCACHGATMHISACWGASPYSSPLMLQEIRLLERISHDRNIVQFYGACLETNPPMLVMEYMGVRAALPHLRMRADSRRWLQLVASGIVAAFEGMAGSVRQPSAKGVSLGLLMSSSPWYGRSARGRSLSLDCRRGACACAQG